MKKWSSYGNSYLRYLEQPRELEDSMIMSTLSVQELQLALEATLRYAKVMNIGKARIEIRRTKIDLNIDASKEMST